MAAALEAHQPLKLTTSTASQVKSTNRLHFVLSPARHPTINTMSLSAHSPNESVVGSTPSEKSMSSQSSVVAQTDYFQELMEGILGKLKQDPTSITREDARRLSENAEARDMRTAKIISAVEAFAEAHEYIYSKDSDPGLDQAPHTSLPTVLKDLSVAVETNPSDVTPEVLRAAQAVVSSE
jgi:hypothetical protein